MTKRKYTCILLFYLALSLMRIESKGQQTLQFDPAVENMNHDIHLSPWGPYSKRYAGISHIADMKSGMRFDVTVCPGYYRNKVVVPNVLFESGYTPWKVSPQMNSITYRYELEWKDQVYTDVTYYTLDSSRVLVEMNCVNNTNVIQNLTLNTLSYIDYPGQFPLFKVLNNDSSMKWISAVDYRELDLVNKSPRYFLIADGQKRNEVRNDSSLDGSLLAEKFGKEINDEVVYDFDNFPKECIGTVFIRYRVKKGATARFQLSGICNELVEFSDTGNFEVKKLSCRFNSENKLSLRSLSTTEIVLDGFFISIVPDAEAPRIVPQTKNPNPILVREHEAKNVLLKYRDINTY
jgi:hypothetical protein